MLCYLCSDIEDELTVYLITVNRVRITRTTFEISTFIAIYVHSDYASFPRYVTSKHKIPEDRYC